MPSQDTPDTEEPRSLAAILAPIIFLIVIIIAAILLINRPQPSDQIASAKPVADQVIGRLSRQDAAGIRQLADAKFKADHSADELGQLIRPIGKIYGSTVPQRERATISNTGTADNVIFIYRYDKLKAPFYIRVIVSRTSSDAPWRMTNLGSNSDETKL